MRTLVIGVAGTGKSFIVKEMRLRGFNAIDADDGLATFVDEEGREIDYDPKGGAEWWRSHYYVLKLDKLQKVLKESDSVYLFGVVGGQPDKGNGLLEVSHLFNRVCYLEAPSELIRRRLAGRTDNPYGKNPEEVKGTIKNKTRMDGEARKRGFEIVDATLPVDEIIEMIAGSDRRNRV